eukprot:6696904-Prymnesium_polylepis.1
MIRLRCRLRTFTARQGLLGTRAAGLHAPQEGARSAARRLRDAAAAAQKLEGALHAGGRRGQEGAAGPQHRDHQNDVRCERRMGGCTLAAR